MIKLLARIASRSVESLKRSTLLNHRAFRVSYSTPRGRIDRLNVEYAGVVIAEGNYRLGKVDPDDIPDCFLDGVKLPLSQTYFTEPHIIDDAESSAPAGDILPRIAFLYEIPVEMSSAVHKIELKSGGKTVFTGKSFFHAVVPPYNIFYNTQEVLNRDHVYTVGPPPETYISSVLKMAKNLESPVLDFGCGTGRLVKIMRENGQDACGIEVESDRIRDNIPSETKEYIKLYDGAFPLPYEANSFKSAMASGVLEHIPEYKEAIRELARVTSDKLVLTVPDMTAIPLCSPYAMVPWHLMESTHFNFFNPNSLKVHLEEYFEDVVIAKTDSSVMNGVKWYQVIMAICTKKKTIQ